MTPTFFNTESDFRKWLEKNHKEEIELWVGFYKVNSGKASMSWSQSVDQALCFGWIDGVRKTIDQESYKIRFTPRRPNSIWSAVNMKKIEVLEKKGLLQQAGRKIFEQRIESVSKIYSYENEEVKFSDEFEKLFKTNTIAWEYFQNLAFSYRKLSTYWVMNAKLDATKRKRLTQLIKDSEAQTNSWKNNKYNKNS